MAKRRQEQSVDVLEWTGQVGVSEDSMLKPGSIGSTVLLVLDGFGCNGSDENNAIAMANTPTWDSLLERCSHTQLACSGSVVGLPIHQMGNSEVGHLHLGAGRLLPQDYARINADLDNGRFQTNPVFCNAVDLAISKRKAVHIIGLLSSGGVHSHEEHIHALTELAVSRGCDQVYVHAFLDGRDTLPICARRSIVAMESVFEKVGKGRFGSLIGRFYAMDRDTRWQRVSKAYDLIVQGKAERYCATAEEALLQAYGRGESDEFVRATAIVPEGEEPVRVEDGDVLVFMNFRADRVRQFVRALTNPGFLDFERDRVPDLGQLVTLTPYHYEFDFPIAFPRERVPNCLGEFLSRYGVKQLRLAETEKYAHVTYFFNGGIDKPYPGESRLLVPSPRVRTYDQMPEMSATEITNHLVSALEEGRYDVIVCNYANCDMVGHTGMMTAAISAVETIDECLGRVTAVVEKTGSQLLITADHGNVEQMVDTASGQSSTSHTLNPVPLVYLGGTAELTDGGSLADVAPTLLELMGLEIPAEMTGRSLLRLDQNAGNFAVSPL